MIKESQIIHGLSFGDYCKIEAMNASTLVRGFRQIGGTARRLHRQINGIGETPTEAMKFGNQYHSMILEPELFSLQYCVMPNFAAMAENVDAKGKLSNSWATTFCKNEKERFLRDAESDGRQVITREDYDRAIHMLESLEQNRRAIELVRTCQKEVTILFEIDGVPFKGRLDLLGKDIIADVKGTTNCGEKPFGSSAARLGYGFKLAIYREGVRQVTGMNLPVEIIAIETGGDFDCVVYEVPEQVLDQGLEFVHETIAEYKACQESGHFPGVDRGSETLPLYWPNWAMRDENDVLDWSDIYEE